MDSRCELGPGVTPPGVLAGLNDESFHQTAPLTLLYRLPINELRAVHSCKQTSDQNFHILVLVKNSTGNFFNSGIPPGLFVRTQNEIRGSLLGFSRIPVLRDERIPGIRKNSACLKH